MDHQDFLSSPSQGKDLTLLSQQVYELIGEQRSLDSHKHEVRTYMLS